MEPLEPVETSITLYRQSRASVWDQEYLILAYEIGPLSQNNIAIDTYYNQGYSTRTIRQDLQLKTAYWFSDHGEVHELPINWFELLGEKISVSVKFDKQFIFGGLPSRLQWANTGSNLRSMTVSFNNFTLPTSKALLRLLPPEVQGLEVDDKD